jgi:DNA-binding transcriptional MerR regulator
MTASSGTLRIGEVAERSGVTPRTIRYYEELGLLPASGTRARGQHRVYGEEDVERLLELTRLRDLLGLSLEELRSMVVAEDVRAEIKQRFHETESPEERRRLLEEALAIADTQLGLVRRRLAALQELETEILDRRKRIQRRRRELSS